MTNNNPPFSIGQRVVALKTVGYLIKGSEHTVLGLFTCSKCNVWYVQYTPSPQTINDRFPCCGTPVVTSGYRAAMADKFAPIREVRDHKSIAVPEELLHIVERDTIEPLPAKTFTP